ncbi:hypothetical protein CJF31_00007621 [Rutstroemia sp. NJR-2017a BVV2]|nr:hypothetical protein CJF31_00007621 [Rutstroemia sp. NJR-2017a BVV2]
MRGGGRYDRGQRSTISVVPEESNDQASDRARVNVDRPDSRNPWSWLVNNLAAQRPDSQLPKSGKEKAAERSPDGSVSIAMQPTIEQRAQQHLDFVESRLAGSSMHQVMQQSNTAKTTRAEESIILEDEEGEARAKKRARSTHHEAEDDHLMETSLDSLAFNPNDVQLTEPTSAKDILAGTHNPYKSLQSKHPSLEALEAELSPLGETSPEGSAAEFTRTMTDISSDDSYSPKPWLQPATSSTGQTSMGKLMSKLNRTMTDIYSDELYNPNFSITPAPPPKSTSTVQASASTVSQNDIFSQRPQAVESQHLSASMHMPSTFSHQLKSPFPQGSPLTHQNERPEKCPIQTYDYHVKGFDRKYDKNRYILTHYKGTMVCGFCPGSGSAAEKSFNRADVFKRHLTSVHAVEQTPPNSRKKTSANINSGKKLSGYAPDATGKCSTCSATFSNAQDFYEHLDDCILRIVQQEELSEAINARHLAEVEQDQAVHETLRNNALPVTTNIYSAIDDKEFDGPTTSPTLEDFSLFLSTSIDNSTAVVPKDLFSSPFITNSDYLNPSNGMLPPNDEHLYMYGASEWDFDGTMPQRYDSGFYPANGPFELENSDHAPHIDTTSPLSPETLHDREGWDIQSIKPISTFCDSAMGSSFPSSSSVSTVQDLPRAAQGEILLTIESDAQLQSLFKELAKKIDKARFIRNIRRLLISFTIELKQNASNPRERDVVNIIERHASWFASRIFDLCDPNKDSKSQLMALQLNQQIDKRLLLEKYLSSNVQRSVRAATPMEEDEADEGDKVDIDTIEINYLKFPNLEHIKGFIVGGSAFDHLRSNTLLFAKNGQVKHQEEAALSSQREDNIRNKKSNTPLRSGHSLRWAKLVRSLILIQRFLGLLKTQSQQQRQSLLHHVDESRCSSHLSGLNSSSEGDDISMETDVTEVTDLDLETDGTDYDSDDLPDDPELSCSAEERILNPRGYFQKLEDLEREVFQNSSVFIHKMGRSMSPQEDEALLLLPGSTTYYHDQGAFIVDIIKKTESGTLLHLLECHNTIYRSMTNLTVLQENGYCGSNISVLTTDGARSDVVRLVSVQIQAIVDLAKSFVDIIKTFALNISISDSDLVGKVHSFIDKQEARHLLTRRCYDLLVNMGITSLHVAISYEPRMIWTLTAQVIELAIISYAGAHIERFDESLFGRGIVFTLLPRRIYHDDTLARIGQTLPIHENCIIKFSRRKLQCMDSFLNGKQPWVFHSQRPYTNVSERLYLSTNIEPLTDLWGPSWRIAGEAAPNGIKQYNIGNGAIIPWSLDSSAFDCRPTPTSSEVFCHWISARNWKDEEVERHQASLKRRHFLSTDTLLIGARSDYGLLVNEKCVPSMDRISRLKTRLWEQEALRPPNVSRAKRYIDSHAVQIQGSAMGFVSGSGQVTYKRRSGHTMKDALVERWRHGLRNPIDLEAYSGVEVSLCSRNARRRRLLNILSSNTMVNYLNGISFFWVSDTCKEAYLKALRCPRSFRKFWKAHKEWRENIGDAISKCLDALEETGIDEDSQELSAFWVESFDEDGDSDGEADDDSVGQPDPSDKDDSDDDSAHGPTALPTPPNSTLASQCSKFFEEWVVTLFRSEHTWTGFLQDSEESLTMAVVEMTCLDFHDQDGFGRNCSLSPTAKGYPVLQTSLHVNESIISSCKLTQEKVSSGQQTIWNARELKKGTSLALGNHGNLEVISSSSKLCPVIVEWKGVKSELLKEVKNVAINEKLLGRGAEKHHHEFIRGTWEVKPLPILVLSKSTKVRFSKD